MRCLHALAAIAPSSPVTARRFFDHLEEGKFAAGYGGSQSVHLGSCLSTTPAPGHQGCPVRTICMAAS